MSYKVTRKSKRAHKKDVRYNNLQRAIVSFDKRYGIELCDADIGKMTCQIISGKATRLHKLENGDRLYKLVYKGLTVHISFNYLHGHISKLYIADCL